MIYGHFSDCSDLKPETINSTINSAYGGARRSLKKEVDDEVIDVAGGQQ